jgi:hypothetical protein
MQLLYFDVKCTFISTPFLGQKGVQMDLLTEKRNISPDKVVSMLKKQGISIGTEDAEQITDFLYFLALLFYKQYAARL